LLITALFFLSVNQVWTQDPGGGTADYQFWKERRFPVMQQADRTQMVGDLPLIGVQAPSFTAETTEGRINFPGDFGENWKILFSHPKDFTPVCSSELLELAHKQESFSELGARLVVVSTDRLEQHIRWKKELERIRYKDRNPVTINFPMVDDNNYKVAQSYGMIHSNTGIGKNIRGVFIIDPENRVRSINFYPNEVGRNIDELKRTLVALQETYNDRNIVTPANWQQGDDFLVPVITVEERDAMGTPESALYQYSWFMTFRKNRIE
jgi:peroxiredoxin 2/4